MNAILECVFMRRMWLIDFYHREFYAVDFVRFMATGRTIEGAIEKYFKQNNILYYWGVE